MPNAGSDTWRFAHDIDQSLHCALYLRDAIGLEVDDRAGNPPRLVGDIPDRSQLLDREATTTAAARWPSWWRAVVGNQALTPLQSSSEQTDSRAWLGELAARHRLVVDPPEWASLADSPALQDAARTLWDEACEWFNPAREPHLPPSGQDVFAWEQVRVGAERAVVEHDVTPGGNQRLRPGPPCRGVLVDAANAGRRLVFDCSCAGPRHSPGHPRRSVRFAPRRMRIAVRVRPPRRSDGAGSSPVAKCGSGERHMNCAVGGR